MLNPSAPELFHASTLEKDLTAVTRGVRVVARRSRMNRHAAADLLQDTVIALLRSRAHFDGAKRASLACYASVTAQRIIGRHWRTRVQTVSAQECMEGLCDPRMGTPADYAAHAEEQEVLRETIRRCTSDFDDLDRLLFQRRCLDQVPVKIISEELDLPYGTVTSRLARLTAKVKSRFRQVLPHWGAICEASVDGYE